MKTVIVHTYLLVDDGKIIIGFEITSTELKFGVRGLCCIDFMYSSEMTYTKIMTVVIVLINLYWVILNVLCGAGQKALQFMYV